MTGTGARELLQPFFLLALAAFFVGLASYLALGRPSHAAAPAGPQAQMEAVSGPSSNDWNLPKHI